MLTQDSDNNNNNNNPYFFSDSSHTLLLDLETGVRISSSVLCRVKRLVDCHMHNPRAKLA